MDPDLTYANGAFIPNSEHFASKWETAASSWREIENVVGRARLNVAYGEGDRQKLDLFYPAGRPRGLLVFIHGGYWHASDRKMWSHLSAGATAREWAVALPSYTLAPQARITEITREIADAITVAAALVAGPIVVTGHSAGGHLAARMACRDVDLAPPVAERLQKVVPISPLSDLRPLLETAMNSDLQLDMAEAIAESPVLKTKLHDVQVVSWVGAEERPAFLDQARWLADAWPGTSLRIAPGRHHFDVIDELLEPDSSLVTALLGN